MIENGNDEGIKKLVDVGGIEGLISTLYTQETVFSYILKLFSLVSMTQIFHS